MKVVFLSDLWDPERGSLVRQIHALCAGLRARGHEAIIVATRQDGGPADRIEIEGTAVHRLPSRYAPRWRPLIGLWNPLVTGRLRSLLAELRPDVVHAHLVHTHLSYRALTLARRAGAAVVFSAHDVMTFCYQKMDCKRPGEEWRARWRRCLGCQRTRFLPGRNAMIARTLRRDVHRVSAVSRALAERLRAHGLAVHALSPNAFLEPRSRPGEAELARARRRWRLGGGPVVLFAGSIQRQKGIEVLLAALARIRWGIPELRLLVAGRREEWNLHAAPEARRLGLEELCRVSGWLSEEKLEEAYGVSDILCVPSTCFETFGLVHLEAQGRGLPAVGSKLGGVPEVIADGVSGFTVDPSDPRELAGRLRRLLVDVELRERMGRAARRRVRREFALEDRLDSWLDLYRAAGAPS